MTQNYWEDRYRTRDMPWEKGAPSPGLVDFLSTHKSLARGTVCVPGCGMGHDARAWAGAGFAVSGFDIAPSAVRLADEATRAAGLMQSFVSLTSSTTPQRKPFDWLFEHTLFCAIQLAERDAYVKALLRWLKPGGFYLAVNYFIPDVEGPSVRHNA
jgi:cyclopropane fatty-acyl-phospholipid synthase-like methyltransferase